MSAQQLNRILCAADPQGNTEVIDRLVKTAADRQVDAIAVIGDLAAGGARESYRKVFRTLGASGLPVFWVPGPGDAPIAHYLREAHDVGIVHPDVHGVHGTAALAPDAHVVVAGIGGEVDDDPDAPREELERLRYPRWEADYRLRILNEFEELQKVVLLFATPPAHKGTHTAGSEVLAELTATYRARLVVCGGERMTAVIGRTMVVAPGSLVDGRFGLADMHAREAELAELGTPV